MVVTRQKRSLRFLLTALKAFSFALLVMLLSVPMRAQAQQSWDLYNGPSAFVSYANFENNSDLYQTPTVNVSLSGNPIYAFPMDTGSTGIIASPDIFQPAAGATMLGFGSIAYTSSGILNKGIWYSATQNIYDANNNLIATANVPVLQVTELSCLSGYPNCQYATPKICTAEEKCGVAFMGIGFDRQSNPQTPTPDPSYNPLLNLTSVAISGNGMQALPDNWANGYVVTPDGIYLGLSASNTANAAFVKLLPNSMVPTDWVGAPMSISVNGVQGAGTILMDTGVGGAFLQLPPGASCASPGANQCANGTTIAISLPGQSIPIAFYTFDVGQDMNPMMPDGVTVVSTGTTFFNTSRHMLGGFNIIFDATNGIIGYQWNGRASSSYGSVTPALALQGAWNIPGSINVDMPAYLFTTLGSPAAQNATPVDVTLSSTGVVIFNQPIASDSIADCTQVNCSTGLVLNPGSFVLNAPNNYWGATTVNAGASLIVNGSIASSVLTTVNSGGTLGGTGTVGNTQINAGGIFLPGSGAPGTAMTVAGNLAFQSGALYLVQVNSTTASSTDVTGTATLNGTVLASFGGSSFQKAYTILHADGGLGGTTFSDLATGGVPLGFATSLSYDSNNVYLDLTAVLGLGGNLSGNEQNVAGAINGYFNNGGTLPPNFLTLFNLSGTNLTTALTSLSGEAATGAQYGAFQFGNQFLMLMLDPFGYGRTGNLGGGLFGPGGALALSDETPALPPDLARAYAKVLKAPPASAHGLPDQRLSVWAGGFGGTNRTKGDPTGIGSHDVTTRTGGYAAGMDYRATPDTVIGFALAGGFTNWGLTNGIGSGTSDAFQAGLYGVTRTGAAYLAGAANFAEYWMKTDRTAFLGDHLQASFDAQSFGGRIEGGYRFATWLAGVTPYAALQAQRFQTPGYNEADVNSGGFGLNYNGRNASDTRSELGARFDRLVPVSSIALLALHGRAAWAHDWVSDPTLVPVFQTLPGASFTVNGATPVANSALASAGAELRFLNGWSLSARFDGEFADRAQTYAGTGTLRYTW